MPKPDSETWITMDRVPTNYYGLKPDTELGKRVLQATHWFRQGQATKLGQYFTNDCVAANDFRNELVYFRNHTPTPGGPIGTFTIVQYISEVESLLRDTITDPALPNYDTFKQFAASNVWENLHEYFDYADPPKNIIQGILDSASGKVKFQSLGHGLVDDDAVTITGSSVAAYNRRHKVRKLSNNEFRSNVDFAGNSGACTFKKALYVKAAGKEAVGIATGDQLADYWIDLRNVSIRELHATRLANRALERATVPWFSTRLLCMDVMTHPMFNTGTPPISDWASQVDFIMRLKNKVRTTGLYVDSLIGWNLMNSTAEPDIDAMSEQIDGIYFEGMPQKQNATLNNGSLQIRRLRRFHSNGRGCLTYLQPRRDAPDYTVAPSTHQFIDDFQRAIQVTAVVELATGIRVTCDRPHQLDKTFQKTVTLHGVNAIYEPDAADPFRKVIYTLVTIHDERTLNIADAPHKPMGTTYNTGANTRIRFTGSDNEVQAMIALWVTGDEAGNAGIWRTYLQVTSSEGACLMTIPTALPAGQELKVTSTIMFVGGPHAGTHTITQVLSATQFVTDRPFISSEGYGYRYLVQGCFIKWSPGRLNDAHNPLGAPWDPINGNIVTGWRAKVGFANGAIPVNRQTVNFQSVGNNGADKCRFTANDHRFLAGLDFTITGGESMPVCIRLRRL